MQQYKLYRDKQNLILVCLYLYVHDLVTDVINIIIQLYRVVKPSLFYNIINHQPLKKNLLTCIPYDNKTYYQLMYNYIKNHYKNAFIFDYNNMTIISSQPIYNCYQPSYDNTVTLNDFIHLCCQYKHFSFESYPDKTGWINLKDCIKLLRNHFDRLNDYGYKHYVVH